MTTYRYETHLHTSEASKCGVCSGAELAHHYRSLGYTGIFVTDHFLNGNTTVPEDSPWPDRVELLCRGYDAAAQEGRKVGLDVFLGWEYSHGWAHFLTYGLGRDWLLANPDLLSWDLVLYLDRVHEGGGSVVHAHPFREGVDVVHLVPHKVDAVEVLNPGQPDECNRHARDFAESFGLPLTAGSDLHSTVGKRKCGVVCPRRLTDATDYMAAVRSGQAVLFDETQQ